MTKPNLNISEDGGCIKVIIEKARKTGYVTLGELLECISSRGITEQDQIDDIVTMIKDMGFELLR